MNLMEKLRPLLGLKNSWDYCVLWKLSQDQRFIEWVSCCCSGAATAAAAAASADAGNIQNGGGEEELLFPVSPVRPCRDLMFQHPTTVHCDLLAQLPSSMPLNSTSGAHAQSLMANQPSWIINDSTTFSSQEAVGTRVLIPVPGGCLVEFFVAKQVYEEDPQIIEFVMAQFTLSWEQQQEAIMNLRSNSTSFQDEFDADGFASKTSSPSNSQFHHHHNQQQQQQQWISPSSNTPSSSTMDGFNLPWDLSVDRIRLCSTSPMNFIGGGLPGQQLPPSLEGSMDSMAPGDKLPPQPSASFDSGFAEIASIHESLMSNAAAVAYNLHSSIESSVTTNKDPPVHDTRDSTKQEIGSRADSVSGCSDQIEDDDEDDRKVVSRSGKKHQSKNLMAERNRRKKLSERLYKLRALVPNISKMDKAAILGDAIEFVKELQKQVKDLQDELEEPEEEGDRTSGNNCHKLSSSAIQLEIPNGTITEHEGSLINGPSNSLGISSNAYDHHHHNGITRCSSNTKTSTEHPSKQSPDSVNDKTHEMEVQVEVTQIDGNEFLLKVFCEHKHGGFVRLMEAMSSLGLEVTSANVTTFRPLVLNVFTVKKKDNELVQAADVRDSLLELTRNPMGLWEEPVGASENGSAIDAHLQHSHQHHLHLQHNRQQHISTAYHQHRHLHPLHHQA